MSNCSLVLVCDWGGTEERCCLDCEKLPDCLKVCRRAETQLMTGEKCRWREDRARNRRDLFETGETASGITWSSRSGSATPTSTGRSTTPST